MKLNIKSKKTIIICIIILIVAILIGLYFWKRHTSTINDELKDNAYIDIWRDNSMDADIDLYSSGSGANEKLYLGAHPLHYLINKNGDIYTYQASSFKYIKTISQSDLQKIENELKSIVENNSSNSISWNSTSWYVKIDGKSTRVNVNVQTQILNKYL